MQWFHPDNAEISPYPAPAPRAIEAQRRWMQAMVAPDGTRAMDDKRVETILGGLSARVQLVQGPPGTGKTQLTAVAIMARISASIRAGEPVLIASHTHTAVNTLLERIKLLEPEVRRANTSLPALSLFKLSSSGEAADDKVPDGVSALATEPNLGTFKQVVASGGVIVIGGTISAMLKLAMNLGGFKKLQKDTGLSRLETKLLIIDEASMMVGAHFLALATLATEDGQIMLAGDNRQLSPIIAHNWEEEERPTAKRFRMHESAFDAVAHLCPKPGASSAELSRARRDSIDDSHRLPAEVVEVLKPLYTLDDIELTSAKEGALSLSALPQAPVATTLAPLWSLDRSVFLLLHDEQTSSDVNPFEIALIEQVLQAGQDSGALRPRSVAIVTPHRAQRATLRRELAYWIEGSGGRTEAVTMIDTVERLQGGEQETIVFSATVSDPNTIAQRVEFILDLKRSNVAFSRPKRRLIVICSRALLDYIPAEVKHYDAALLWKGLRDLCDTPVAANTHDGHRWELLVRRS
jgi:hypothetical protein